MNRIAVVPFAAAALAAAVPAFATPSSTFWAPSTPYLQPYGVLHVTYDTYFGGESQYPTTSGLEIGVLSGKGLQAQVGFDLLYPTYAGGEPLDFPVLFNAKLGGPEGALFDGAPASSAGIYGVGLEADVTDYDALHLMLGKTTGIGFLAAGGYYGLNETLFRSSAGEANQAGAMAMLDVERARLPRSRPPEPLLGRADRRERRRRHRRRRLRLVHPDGRSHPRSGLLLRRGPPARRLELDVVAAVRRRHPVLTARTGSLPVAS